MGGRMSDHRADEPLDERDEEVLRSLAGVLAKVDPVPPDLADEILVAMTLDRLQAEVMEIQVADAPELVLRSDTVDRETVRVSTITFACEAVTVMITVSDSPTGGLCIDGWAAPAERYVVELYRPDDRTRVESEEDGAFVILDVPHGRACLALRRADGTGPTVATPVIEL